MIFKIWAEKVIINEKESVIIYMKYKDYKTKHLAISEEMLSSPYNLKVFSNILIEEFMKLDNK